MASERPDPRLRRTRGTGSSADAPQPARGDSARELVSMLARLGTVPGDALYLIYFRRLTQAEAADALGIPRASIGRYVEQGLRVLGRQLEQAT